MNLKNKNVTILKQILAGNLVYELIPTDSAEISEIDSFIREL
jgi:hypothetical protein